MPIRWDSVLVRHIAQELNEALAGARLRAVRLDGHSRDFVLLFRECTLLWRLHPDRGYLRLRGALEPEDSDLRVRAKVRRVTAPVDERLVRFELLAERGHRGSVELVVELLGNQWNAVVTEGPESIIRHVLKRRERPRALRVGQRYVPPPSTGRLVNVELDEWLGVLGDSPPQERSASLVQTFAWTSPLNAETILGSGTAEDADGALRDAYERWRTIAVMDDTQPVLLETKRGLQPYPASLTGMALRPIESLLAGFEECMSVAEAEGEIPAALELGLALVGRLADSVRHHERRLARLRAELAEVEDADALRARGDLILARYTDIGVGATEVTLIDFEGSEARIELDPTLRAHENAARYYSRAARASRAVRRLPDLIETAVRALARLQALLAAAHQGKADPDEVRAALPKTGLRRRGGEAYPSLPYRTFRSSGGLEIRVGRGARHNDDLTFRHSAPGDVWMHVRESAGAHVVLRWPGPGAPPARDLEEAATLAALHSKARTSGNVPVDWTYRKYVRKPRGSAPGSVVPDRVKTIFVAPDPSIMASLAEPPGD